MPSQNATETARSSAQINSYTNLLAIEETRPLIITRGECLWNSLMEKAKIGADSGEWKCRFELVVFQQVSQKIRCRVNKK